MATAGKSGHIMREMDFGLRKVASVTPSVSIANPGKNVKYIIEELSKPILKDAQIVVFPELCISGYTCADLFFQTSLIEECTTALLNFCECLKGDHRFIVVGVPVLINGRLFNCAAAVCNGRILGIVPKIHIPNYQEFYEKRWFVSGKECLGSEIEIAGKVIPFGNDILFCHQGVKIGIEICEDLWVPNPPSVSLCCNGADIILNLSATDDNIGKYEYIKSLVSSQSSRCRCIYAYASAGYGESSTDLVFSGINIIVSDGFVLNESERFSYADTVITAIVDVEKLRNDRKKYATYYDDPVGPLRTIFSESKTVPTSLESLKTDMHPFVPSDPQKRDENCKEIVNIQSWGLARRLDAINGNCLVVGISGGLDSTLALLVAHHTFINTGRNPKGIFGVTMPADATSARTHNNARKLMDELGVTFREIPIGEAVTRHFIDIGHDPSVFNAVYENSQARERTQILMDLANKHGGIVLGTGDMSELALGWCTYNGDHMSMYNVNGSVPKTLVKYLVGWFADKCTSPILKEVLIDIMDTPISPELVPASEGEDISQKTEDLIGPYELHDFFLFHVVRNGFSPSKIYFLASKAFKEKYDNDEIKKWLINFYRRFFSQQFKRSCMPDGPKVGSVCLSPRGDWRMPSDASVALWVDEAENL